MLSSFGSGNGLVPSTSHYQGQCRPRSMSPYRIASLSHKPYTPQIPHTVLNKFWSSFTRNWVELFYYYSSVSVTVVKLLSSSYFLFPKLHRRFINTLDHCMVIDRLPQVCWVSSWVKGSVHMCGWENGNGSRVALIALVVTCNLGLLLRRENR